MLAGFSSSVFSLAFRVMGCWVCMKKMASHRWLAVNWNQMDAYVPGLSLIFFLLQSLGSEFPVAKVTIKIGILCVHKIWELIEGFDLFLPMLNI